METWLLIASQPPVCSVTQTSPVPSLGLFLHYTVGASGIWSVMLLLGPKIVGDGAPSGCVSPWLMKSWCSPAGSGLSTRSRGAALSGWPLPWKVEARTSLPPPGPPRPADQSPAPETAALPSINSWHENHAGINRNC